MHIFRARISWPRGTNGFLEQFRSCGVKSIFDSMAPYRLFVVVLDVFDRFQYEFLTRLNNRQVRIHLRNPVHPPENSSKEEHYIEGQGDNDRRVFPSMPGGGIVSSATGSVPPLLRSRLYGVVHWLSRC